MAQRWLTLVLIAATLVIAAGCVSRSPSPRPTETRTLQSIEVDGSVRMRGNAYRR